MKNLVLVCWDAVRSDRLSCSGYERETTPVLDALDKALFTNVVSASTHTCPSLASILTGTYVGRHKRYDGDLVPLVPTVFSYLEGLGYSSSIITGNPWAHILCSSKIVQGPGVGGLAIVGSFERWLREESPEPFVTLLHFLEAHDFAYDIKENNSVWSLGLLNKFYPIPSGDFDHIENREERMRVFTAVQDAGTFVLDSLLTRILDAVPPDTLVVVFSDHGEEFREHGKLGHGQNVYNEVVFVFCAFIGVQGGAPVRWVSSTDIIPTSLALLDLSIPAWMQGVNVLGNGGGRLEKLAITELYDARCNWSGANWASIYQGDRKLTVNYTAGKRQLSDPVLDPGESVLLDEPKVCKRLYNLLQHTIEDSHIQHHSESICFYDDPMVIARLKELGYLG